MSRVNAPTVWEEGHLSADRITRLAIVSSLLAVGLDLAITQHLSPIFDVLFVVLCGAAALAVRPRDFFRVGVLPPLLLLGITLLLVLIHRAWVADAQDGVVQAVVSGLAHHATALMLGYALALALLGTRTRFISRHPRTPAVDADPHSKREGSPAPTRVTSGEPSEKSTTVVGSVPHSPQSITTSSH